MRENQQQLFCLEEELFHTALLGLLELEGRQLMRENQQLQSQSQHDGSAARLRKLEKQARRRQTLRLGCQKVQKAVKPVIVHAAVIFLVLSMSAGALLWASADAREILYTLVITQYERYTEINYRRQMQSPRPEEELKYIDAGASFMPTYLPEGLEMGSTEQGRYSYAVTYENPKDPAQWIVFRQVTAAQQLVIQVDTENADSVRWLPIGQSEAMVVVKDGCTQVVWRVGDVFLSVVAEQIPQEEALAFAYGISEI